MLAKLWKKIALGICMVAILFNITSKLIRRTNLKSELQSVLGGTSIHFSEESVSSETEENTSSEETSEETN